MNKNNKTYKEIFIEAFENYKKKNFKKSEALCYKILSIDANHFDSIMLLSNISAISKNFHKAKELLHKAIEIRPDNVTALNNLGIANKELGDHKEAISYYQKVIRIDPKHTNANYNLGVAYYLLKDINNAKKYFKKTVEIQTNFALAFYALANVHVDLKEHESAISCYQKAIEINPNLISAYNNLGLVFRELNDFENSIKNYEKAIKINFNYAASHHNLALALKELGRFDEAIKSHKNAIKCEPENLMNYFYLSELEKNTIDLKLKNKIEKNIKNKNTTKRNIAYGNYLLGKYEKKSKNHKKEFNFLIKGHQAFFESKKEKFNLGIKYCFDDVLQIEEGATVEKIKEKDEYNVMKPIFIIGVPRCGSTLVEKIIGSGEKFVLLGEETAILENFVNSKILEKKSLNLGNVHDIRKQLFNLYKNKGLMSEKYDYLFTDKSLNNFFYLKLIKDIYPNAKVINCKRDVISSIMSIFQNNLTELSWTHNLENIFKYFDNYFEIVKNFNRDNPDFIYELQFEKLVSQPEGESKKLMKFCGLPWSKKCLEFYKREDLISRTASNIQIRKAIFKHTKERYLPYKNFLDKYGKGYSWYN